MIVLGIESTCDETGAALVQDGQKILSNVLSSSAEIHQKYGGVFPELASRGHIEAILGVVDEAIQKGGVTPEEIDLIAVANGPGLVGALLVGVNAAKGLAIAWNKPLIGVNHVEAHLYASMMGIEPPLLPALGIVLSGGHTLMVKILDVGLYEPIGTTVDDAIGEAFDKVASLLSLPYPGGPHVEEMAKGGRVNLSLFKGGRVKKSPFDFSFSGLKTAVLYAVRRGGVDPKEIAASFQETAFRDVIEKCAAVIKTFPCQALFLGGGVCNNRRLREMFAERFPHLPIFWPPPNLSVDNGAMIAGLGAKKFHGISDPLDFEVRGRIPFA